MLPVPRASSRIDLTFRATFSTAHGTEHLQVVTTKRFPVSFAKIGIPVFDNQIVATLFKHLDGSLVALDIFLTDTLSSW